MQHKDIVIFVPHVKYLKLGVVSGTEENVGKNQVFPSDFFFISWNITLSLNAAQIIDETAESLLLLPMLSLTCWCALPSGELEKLQEFLLLALMVTCSLAKLLSPAL